MVPNCQFYTLACVKLSLMTKKVKRLFEQFQPTHYIVELKPDKEKLTFTGSVIISGKKVGKPSSRITLHQKDLKITGAHIIKHDKKGDTEVPIERFNLHSGFDEVRLHAKEILYPGFYTVSLNFSGKITHAMNGLYPAFDKAGHKEKVILATQFESHYAREVFPCIDEPEAKATFDLILKTKPGDEVLANTPVVSEEKDGDLIKTTFETTPHMSTYLLAFVIGNLKYKEAKTKRGVTVRTYATPHNAELTKFALEVATKCLDFFEQYFDIDFPLQKCDFVALPDFAAGAMENWGLITFREQALLVDPKNTSVANKQYVAHVVAHELTHQWFGNLVTMRWWTDLWLNEGFATWMSYLAVDHIFPEWEMWTQFVVDDQQQALKLDALEHTHPIEVPVNHPDEIRVIFDAISYDKGASIIHMLYEYLEHKTFQAGIRYYLKKHAYSNTDTTDLWSAMEEASEKPVKDFMHAWTSQAGFPLLRVDVQPNKVKLSQETFFINPAHSRMPEEVWPIPLETNSGHLVQLLDKKSSELSLTSTDNFKVNQGQAGFYRTTYNISHLQQLGEHVKRGRMPVLDRLGLLNDVVESAKAGHLDTADALKFLTNFENEDNYAVWDVIAGIIGSLRMVMQDEELREDIKPFIRKLTRRQLERLGWTKKAGEKHFDKLLRPIILGLAASADEPEVVKKCLQIFDKASGSDDISSDLKTTPLRRNVRRGGDIDPDLRGVIFGTAARKGGLKEFERMLKMHDRTLLSEEKVALSAALTAFKQPEIIDKALSLITSNKIRLQDTSYWIAYSFLNRHAKAKTWDWLRSNWGWVKANLGTDHAFPYMAIYSARSFSDESFIKEYKEFFNSVMEPSLERSYRQGYEIIQWQSAWKKRALKEVKTFFKAQSEN